MIAKILFKEQILQENIKDQIYLSIFDIIVKLDRNIFIQHFEINFAMFAIDVFCW